MYPTTSYNMHACFAPHIHAIHDVLSMCVCMYGLQGFPHSQMSNVRASAASSKTRCRCPAWRVTLPEVTRCCTLSYNLHPILGHHMPSAVEAHGCVLASHTGGKIGLRCYPCRSVEGHVLPWLLGCRVRMLLEGVVPPSFSEESVSWV